MSEIYPQAIRGRATSLSSTMHGVFGIAFTLTFPLFLHGLGLTITLIGYAVIGIVGALYLSRTLPETRAKTLEEITAYWNERANAAPTAQKAADESSASGV
jgi:SP family arabinose:H+ symporter-like MFS transporter